MELERADRITAGAIGEPGHRTFYLQARTGGELITVVVEKQQVELLSASILELLSRIDKETGAGPSDEELEGLEGPVEPRFRVGRLSIGYEEEHDVILLELEELLEEDEPEADQPASGAEEPERIRLWATREQMLALSRHGAAVAGRGRPTCQFCGNPMDPEGHTCPAMNGHTRPAR
ncbi:MAG TPA: DUF3090 domain-containing protein [Actinomycetota bacterium]|nr:DUF3090 domain-containing protein [Actinomycetota bacterium]